MAKVLVVVDMQNDFIDGSLGTREAEQIVGLVAEKISQYQRQAETIYFTKDTHQTDYLETQEGRNLPVLHCVKGTAGWHLAPQIQSAYEAVAQGQKGEVLFEKGQFGSLELAQHIQRQYPNAEDLEIELVGLCTDICVLANALVLKTYMPEVKIRVDQHCCAGVTPESHENALSAMKMCQIEII